MPPLTSHVISIASSTATLTAALARREAGADPYGVWSVSAKTDVSRIRALLDQIEAGLAQPEAAPEESGVRPLIQQIDDGLQSSASRIARVAGL